MIRIAAPFILLLLAVPATGWACFGSFDLKTYPSEFAIVGVFFGTLLRMILRRKLEDREALSRAIFFSSVIAGYGVGFFLASTSSPFGWSGYTFLAGFFTLAELAKYTSVRNKLIAQLIAVVITGFFVNTLFDARDRAARVGEIKQQKFDSFQQQQFNEVRF